MEPRWNTHHRTTLQQSKENIMPSTPPHQTQSSIQERSTTDLSNEYLDAKRAAVEAVEIGRETLAESARQGEQLQHADEMANQTRFALDKSGRILRGMTWSGWFANLVSQDVKEEDYLNSKRPSTESLCQYEGISEIGSAAAQAIQNMQANLLVLEACETEEQRQMCIQVCDDMYTRAAQEVSKLHANGDSESLALVKRFLTDLSKLRGRLKACKRNKQWTSGVASKSADTKTPAKATAPNITNNNTKSGSIFAEQDEHLEFISQHLGELTDIAHSLHESFATQSQIVESLDGKSDEILDTSKMVTRRADRLIQKKSWTRPKQEFYGHVAVRHLQSGHYIAETNKSLRLANKLGPQSCTFALWKRPNGMFGLQHKLSGRWIGQTALAGSLACSATKFSAREEWQADDDWKETRLLCVSAGWGNGGYLVVRNDKLTIGRGDIDAKKLADLWYIEDVESTNNER